MTRHPQTLLSVRENPLGPPKPRKINIHACPGGRMHDVTHTQGQVKQHAKQQGAVAAKGQGGQAERRQASGRPRAVSERRGASTGHNQAAHAHGSWLLTSPAGPLTTRTAFPQEAGGVLERVESRKQGAVGKAKSMGESAGKGPHRRVLGLGSPWQSGFQEAQKTQKLDVAHPHKWPMLGHRKTDERAQGEDPTYCIIPHVTCPPARCCCVCPR